MHGGAFGLACVDFRVAVPTGKKATRAESLVEGFGYLLSHPHFADRDVDVFVTSRSFERAVTGLLATWPRVTVRTAPTTGYLAHLALGVARLLACGEPAETEQGAQPPSATLEPGVRLTCATDGSLGWRKNPVGTYAWVTEDGRHGHGSLRRCEVRTVELAAVVDLLDQVDGPLRVLIDNAAVLDLVTRIQAALARGESTTDPALSPPWARHLAARAAALLPGRDVEFADVTAHSGHPLNDTADALAVYSRRCIQLDTPEEVQGPCYERIVAEGLARWADLQP